MALLIDPPHAAGHGRMWSHLASDVSFEELHVFARSFGVPERGFDRDHYDVPAEWYDRVVAAGVQEVSPRELIARLHAAGLRRPKGSTMAPRRPGRVLLRPHRLRPGDVVAVVSPAGPADPGRVAAGEAVLRGWGLEVRRSRAEAPRPFTWLAGDDERRAVELTEAWTDPDVRAVWTTRGGFGSQRVLDLLDWDRLAEATPRLLVGFSDVTALHQAVAARLGTATLHAPGLAGLGDRDPATEAATRQLLMQGGPVVLSAPATPGGGRATGVLVGGNLTVLAASSGTGHVRPAAGGIALLEDVGERPYRLDRALTQLLRAGWFDAVHGVALGSFVDCGDPADVRRLLAERLAPLGVPVLHDLPFGHLPTNLPVPLGVRADLDVDRGTLTAERGLR